MRACSVVVSNREQLPPADNHVAHQCIDNTFRDVAGTPLDDDLDFVTSERALAFIKRQRGNPLASLSLKYKKHGELVRPSRRV